MRSKIPRGLRRPSVSLTAIPPASTSAEYSTALASVATQILYRSPLPSQNDLPIFVLNAAAFPDTKDVDFDALLPYVLSRLPDEDELIGGRGYEIVFFAGGGSNGATAKKKGRPGWGWLLQAYNLLTRATRKRLQKLYIVHEKNWIRVLFEMFSTAVSPKFRKKVVHGEEPPEYLGDLWAPVLTLETFIVSTLTGLALHIPIEDLLIPPSAYMADRRHLPHIDAPYARGKRAFGVKQPLPLSSSGAVRLPRVLREATSFVLMDRLIKTEGVFRMSARAMTVDILKEAYDRGQKFIVWKEGNVVLTHNHRRDGFGDVWVDELDQCEGWELHAAAGLIKQWYKELRDPIFPQSCYAGLERFYGDPGIPFQISQLLAILNPDTEWSPISKSSRTILVMHLLPLLSRIADFSEFNRMTPQNLAVCFAPTLLRSPDPIEDVKISAIIQRILEAMISHWNKHLAPKFDMDIYKFEESHRMPEALSDREDPLEETQQARSSEETQITGITLLDNDSSGEEEQDKDLEPPPLPPRPAILTDAGGQGEGSSQLKRKPAPQVLPLPRYSMLIAERPANMQAFWNTVPTEEDVNPEPLSRPSLDTLPEYQTLPTPPTPVNAFTNTVPTAGDIGATDQPQELPEYKARSPLGAAVVRKPVPKGEGRDA